MKYAPSASPKFDRRFNATLRHLAADVASALGSNLQALILGGGYGRGEGAVVRHLGQEYPYNDLDLTLVVQRSRRVSQRALAAAAARYANDLRIEIDFSRPLTVDGILNWPRTLMWHDLVHAHAVLWGPPEILSANAPRAVWDPPPPIEATRLLLNRGAGLLWATRVQKGLEPPPDGDFVRRNYYKCLLALGDAILIVHRRYTTSCVGRGGRLAGLAKHSPTVAALELDTPYSLALRFKWSPDEFPATPNPAEIADLARRWGDVFLQVERFRTHREFSSSTEYARWTGVRETERNGFAHGLRNILHNRAMGSWSWRYPRERLYRELPVLLEMDGVETDEWAKRSEAFLRVWKRCN